MTTVYNQWQACLAWWATRFCILILRFSESTILCIHMASTVATVPEKGVANMPKSTQRERSTAGKICITLLTLPPSLQPLA